MASGSQVPAARTATGIIELEILSPKIVVANKAAAAAKGELQTLLTGMAAHLSTADPAALTVAQGRMVDADLYFAVIIAARADQAATSLAARQNIPTALPEGHDSERAKHERVADLEHQLRVLQRELDTYRGVNPGIAPHPADDAISPDTYTVVPAAAAAPPLPRVKAPSFDGDQAGMKFATWLEKFNSWADGCKVPICNRLFYATQSLQRDAAEQWSLLKRQLLIDGKDPTDWDTICTASLKKYRETSSNMVLRDRLLALQQTGTVAAYYDAFVKLLAIAVPHPVTATDTVWFFLHGLQSRIRLTLVDTDAADLDDMVMHAKRMEFAPLPAPLPLPTVLDMPMAEQLQVASHTSASRRRRRRRLLASHLPAF